LVSGRVLVLDKPKWVPAWCSQLICNGREQMGNHRTGALSPSKLTVSMNVWIMKSLEWRVQGQSHLSARKQSIACKKQTIAIACIHW
jgi:hypothetical protein